MSTPVPQRLFVWMLSDPMHPVLVGQVNRLANGDVSLTYCDAWAASGFALSEDLPLGLNEYLPAHRTAQQSAAPGALDDARPDQWGEKVIRYLHKPRNHLFEYLYFAGDDRFGALGISSSDQAYTPHPAHVLPRLKDAQRISDVAAIIQQGGELDEQQRQLAAADASLGGAKPKAVISIDGEPWVLKLFNAEAVDQPLVEHASMTLAAKAGIKVARTMPVRLLAEHAVAIKRFDRLGTQRLHCVSAATVLRAETPTGQMPNYGYPHLARVLRRFADVDTVNHQLLDLFRRMVFNILIANTDDHEKNHALIFRNTSSTAKTTVLELSSAYDIGPTGSGATRHQFLIGEDSAEPSLHEAMGVCAQFDLAPQQAAQEVARLIGVVNTWQNHYRHCGVLQRDLDELKPVIDRDDLLAQRANFKLGDYPDTTNPRAKKSRARG